MRQFTLHKSERLYLRESIGDLFANGKSFMAFPYRVVYLIKDEKAEGDKPALQRNSDRQARCAILAIAPKKRFKHAVDRNHVKRLTREAYRLQKPALLEALEKEEKSMEVAFLYCDNKFIEFDETHKVIGKALNKLQRLVASPNK